MTLKKRLRGILMNSEGLLRVGWQVALGGVVYAAIFYGVRWALGALFGVLFSVWGLTVSNLSYAPAWAQWLVSVHAGIVYGAAYLMSMMAGLWMAKRWTKKVPSNKKHVLTGLLAGLGLGLFVTVLSLLGDSMRLEWPLSEPALGFHLLGSILMALLGKASGTVPVKRLLLDPVRRRFGRGWGIAAACLGSLLLMGEWNSVLGVVNALCLGWIGCEIYLRGGFWASAAFETGWTVFTAVLFASPAETSLSLYRLYHVSDAWLTGGNAGPVRGLACTVGCLAILAVLYRKSIRRTFANEVEKHGKNQDCNRGTGLKGRGLLRSGADGDEGSRTGGRHRRTQG